MSGSKYVHIGARPLDSNIVLKTLPEIANLKSTIDSFRETALSYHKINDFNIDKEQYNNVISILGNRGIGKTSTLLTIIREIQSNSYFIKQDITRNDIDLFSTLIAPEDMSENSDILGWIIITLQNVYSEINKSLKNKMFYNTEKLDKLENNILECLRNLSKSYQYRKPESNKVVNENYSTIIDYANQKINIEKDDFELASLFKKTINYIIDYKRQYNLMLMSSDIEKEPLFFFFFDDVDVVTSHSVNILKDIVTFLSHPNIVVVISGDYKVFSQSATINMLEEEGIHHGEIDKSYVYGSDEGDDTALSLAKSRSEYFLRKVLPPIYRYELKPLTNEDKGRMNYGNQLEVQKSIVELITEKIGYDKENKTENFLYISNENFFYGNDVPLSFRNTFKKKYWKNLGIKTEIDFKNKVENTEVGNRDYYVVYPYLSIFSSSARGFMNVYNYLIYQTKNKSLWNLKDLSNFLDIVINSKSTFLRYRSSIEKFLRIKKINIDSNPEPTDLIIDCEELRIFILSLNEPKNKEQLLDYEALIMLPIFFNELGYAILNKNDNGYAARYESVKLKLKRIFLNQYMEKINGNIQLFPYNQSMKMILSFYHRLTTRISLEGLKYLISDADIMQTNEKKYDIRNDKKYFIQLYRCYLYFYQVLYFKDNNNQYYIYNGNKLVNIDARGDDFDCSLKDAKLEILTLTEQKYRNAIVRDPELRRLYEKILYSYCCLRFKSNKEWLYYLKKHARHCMNAVKIDGIEGNLFPFEDFLAENIFFMIDDLKKNKDLINDVSNLEITLSKFSKLLDIEILFNNELFDNIFSNLVIDSLLKLRKKYKKSYPKKEEKDSIYKLLKLKKYTNEIDRNNKYENSSILAIVDKAEKTIMSFYDNKIIFSNHEDGENAKKRKKSLYIIMPKIITYLNNKTDMDMRSARLEFNTIVSEVCDNIIESCSYIFNRFNRQPDNYHFDLYDIANEIIMIISRYSNYNFIDENIEDLVLQNLADILQNYNNEKNEEFLIILQNLLKDIAQMDETKSNACIDDIKTVILRETRFIRAINFGITENSKKELDSLVVDMLPIYIVSIYLKAGSIDESLKRDYRFFYNIYNISCQYE